MIAAYNGGELLRPTDDIDRTVSASVVSRTSSMPYGRPSKQKFPKMA